MQVSYGLSSPTLPTGVTTKLDLLIHFEFESSNEVGLSAKLGPHGTTKLVSVLDALPSHWRHEADAIEFRVPGANASGNDSRTFAVELSVNTGAKSGELKLATLSYSCDLVQNGFQPSPESQLPIVVDVVAGEQIEHQPGGFAVKIEQPEEKCPHCNAKATLSKHPEFRFGCDVCGGPRIPTSIRKRKPSSCELNLLRKAKSTAQARSGWRVTGTVSALLTSLDVLILMVLWFAFDASLSVIFVGVCTALPLAAFSHWAFGRANKQTQEVAASLQDAWKQAGLSLPSKTIDPYQQ